MRVMMENIKTADFYTPKPLFVPQDNFALFERLFT
jgi:hypothetical protein